MVQIVKRSWHENDRSSGKFSGLAYSQANRFNMNPAPQKHLTVTNAAFPDSSANLFSVSSSGHEIEVTDAGSLTIMLPLQGRVKVKYGNRNHFIGARDALCFGPSRRLTSVDTNGTRQFEANLIKLPMNLDTRAILSGEFRTGRTEDPFIPSAASAVQGLSDLITYILADLASENSVLKMPRSYLLAHALLMEHVRCLVNPSCDEGEGRRKNVGHAAIEAEEFMRAHYADPLTVGEISAAVGLSTRQLQTAFQRAMGVSPWSRLTSIRLQEARYHLIAAQQHETVSSILLDCGFTHMGRFSKLYRDAFGELPSETLRAARRF